MIYFLYDADLILEALLNRSIYAEDAENIWRFIQFRPNRSYITEYGLERIKSFISNFFNNQAAEEIVCKIKDRMLVCRINSNLCQKIRASSIKHIDSAVEVACANNYNISAIITNNPQKYVGANLPVFSVDGLSMHKLNLEIEKFYQKLHNSSISWDNELLKNQHLRKIQNQEDVQYLEELFKKESCIRQKLESQLIYFPKPTVNYKNLESTKSSQKSTQLTNWLENNYGEEFKSNWQSVEDIFDKKQITYRYRYAAMGMQWSKLAKKIDLGNGCLMALVVQVALNQLNEVDLLLQLYAVSTKGFLLNNTKLIILDDFENEFMVAKSKEKDIGIQLAFKANFGDNFIVKVLQDKNIFTEYFII